MLREVGRCGHCLCYATHDQVTNTSVNIHILRLSEKMSFSHSAHIESGCDHNSYNARLPISHLPSTPMPLTCTRDVVMDELSRSFTKKNKQSCVVDASRNQVEGSGVIYMRPHMRLAQSARLLVYVRGPPHYLELRIPVIEIGMELGPAVGVGIVRVFSRRRQFGAQLADVENSRNTVRVRLCRLFKSPLSEQGVPLLFLLNRRVVWCRASDGLVQLDLVCWIFHRFRRWQ